MRKIAFALLLMFSISFASWYTVAGLAMLTSLAIIGVIFILGMGFGIAELTMLSKEEFYQLMVLGVLMVFLVGSDTTINQLSGITELSGDFGNIQDASVDSLQKTRAVITDYFNGIVAAGNQMEMESGKSTYCSILGAGYSVSGCGGFGMLSPMFANAGSMTGFAIGELAAIEKLIQISNTYSLTLLLPFGIVLRTLKLTRGAGGLVLALAVSMHFMLPLGILFVDMLGENFLAYGDVADPEDFSGEIAGIDADIDEPYDPELTIDLGVLDDGRSYICDAANVFFGANEERAVDAYDVIRENMRVYMYMVLIKATLGPIIALLMFVTSLRFLTGLAGAEVDVTGLAKVV